MCKSRGCSVRVPQPNTFCEEHSATIAGSKRRTRSVKVTEVPALSAVPPAKRAKTKSALPSLSVDTLPPSTMQIAADASSQKCSYHDCPNRAKVIQTYGVFCNRHAVVFPCGFPGCRDKAPTNGTRCAKHAEQGTAMLDEALAVRSQSIPVCRTKGCFKNDQGRGYCRGHEKLMMATGQLPHAINKRRLNSAYTMCCYPGCGKHSQRNHLCRIHGNELIKQAQHMVDTKQTTESFEQVLSQLQKELRRCTHPDCEKNAQRDRLCTTHFHLRGQAEKGLDKSVLSSEVKEKVLKICSEDKCTLPVYCNWLCQQHYEQREKKGKASTALKPSKDPPQKQLKHNAKEDLIPFPHAGAASMVDLLYPQKDPLYPELSVDDKPSVYPSFPRPFNRLSFDYEPSASFLPDTTLYPRTSTCTNASCNREVLGKGLCEVCLGVSAHVNFSETLPSTFPSGQSFDSKASSSEFAWSQHNHQQNTSGAFFYHDTASLREAKLTPYSSYYYDLSTKQKQCNFPSCRMPCKAPLCLLHASATLCSSPSCQELVVAPGFCPMHNLHQCAVQGCHHLLMGTNLLSCLQHDSAPRCNHTQCFKFAVKGSAYCGVHQGQHAHCKLCILYDMVCPLQSPPPSDLKENTHGSLANMGSTNGNVHKMSL